MTEDDRLFHDWAEAQDFWRNDTYEAFKALYDEVIDFRTPEDVLDHFDAIWAACSSEYGA